MSKKSSTTIVDQPVLTISDGQGLKVLKGARLRAGGHFYATDDAIFAANDQPVRHVFIQVETGGIVDKAFVLSAGTSIASVRVKVVEQYRIFATVHPMYKTSKKLSVAGYYLPVGAPIAPDATTPASNDDSTAPPITVTIILVQEGKKGKLRNAMPIVAVGPKGKEPGVAEIDETA